MKMNQVSLLNLKCPKAIFYFPEYFNLKDEQNLLNLTKQANLILKIYQIEKFILLGYFEQKEVKYFFSQNLFKELNNPNNSTSSDISSADELNNLLDFQFILIDFFDLIETQKIFGYSPFIFILDNNNKILFSTRKYFLKPLLKITIAGLFLLFSLIYFPILQKIIKRKIIETNKNKLN